MISDRINININTILRVARGPRVCYRPANGTIVQGSGNLWFLTTSSLHATGTETVGMSQHVSIGVLRNVRPT